MLGSISSSTLLALLPVEGTSAPAFPLPLAIPIPLPPASNAGPPAANARSMVCHTLSSLAPAVARTLSLLPPSIALMTGAPSLLSESDPLSSVVDCEPPLPPIISSTGSRTISSSESLEPSESSVKAGGAFSAAAGSARWNQVRRHVRPLDAQEVSSQYRAPAGTRSSTHEMWPQDREYGLSRVSRQTVHAMEERREARRAAWVWMTWSKGE